MSSRLAFGSLRWASTTSLSSLGNRRMISDTLRHWPDLARSNALSIAGSLVIIAPYAKRTPEMKVSLPRIPDTGAIGEVPEKTAHCRRKNRLRTSADDRLPKRLCRRRRHASLRARARSPARNRCTRDRGLSPLAGLRSRRREGVEKEPDRSRAPRPRSIRANHRRSLRTSGSGRLGWPRKPVVLAAG